MAKKKEKKPSKPIKVHEYYKKEGDALKREKKSCPKCGAGTFMATHKNRSTCGKCHYCEFN
ncbi:30S ribosomal protein S27ae [Candidatus Woesearchaeota archaeon]|nr:30S ribosomal protein S27ae [Candidatus Woesearchaeota archaeon]